MGSEEDPGSFGASEGPTGGIGDFEDSDPVEIEFSVNLPIARMLAFSSGFVGSSGGVTEPEEETDLEMEDGIEETASDLGET